jgi:MmgE/PrpD family.
VRVTLKDGRTFHARALTNKGDTEDPYSRDEVIAKFREVTEPVIGAERSGAILDMVLSLETAGSLAPLVALMEGRT